MSLTMLAIGSEYINYEWSNMGAVLITLKLPVYKRISEDTLDYEALTGAATEKDMARSIENLCLRGKISQANIGKELLEARIGLIIDAVKQYLPERFMLPELPPAAEALLTARETTKFLAGATEYLGAVPRDVQREDEKGE